MRRVTLTKFLFRRLMDSVDNNNRALNGHQRRRVAVWWEKLDPLMADYLAEIDKLDAWKSKANREAEFNFSQINQNEIVYGWKLEGIDHELGGWFDDEPVSIIVKPDDFGAIASLWKPDREDDDLKIGGRHWRRVVAAIDKALAEAEYLTEQEVKEAEEKPSDNGRPDNVKEMVKAGKIKKDD